MITMKAGLSAALASAAALSSCFPAWAQDDAAARFGAREHVLQMSLAPDGKHIAYLAPDEGRGTTITVIDLADGKQTVVGRSSGSPDRLRTCHWSTSQRLVCSIYMIIDGVEQLSFTRLLAVDVDGRNPKILNAPDSSRALAINQYSGGVIDWLGDGSDSTVLMTRVFVPERTMGTLLAKSDTGLGVERVDTVTLKRTTVEMPKEYAAGYLTDGHGVVRIMAMQGRTSAGYDKNSTYYMYRRAGSKTWEELGHISYDGTLSLGFEPAAVDRDENVVYGFDYDHGHKALVSISLDGKLTRDIVLAQNDVDVDDLIEVGRQRHVVGASFATDKRMVAYFDPTLKTLSAALSKALPGLPLVSIIDASGDETKLLLFAGSDVDAGRYYLYDKPTRKLEELIPARPQLAATKLATVKSVSYPAADGTMIPAYLTLPPGSDGKNLPTIVMPHGGPEARDEWGFDWLSQFFANRGYAVLQPNFRGSAGYGEAWFQKNGFQSWQTAVGDVDDGARWLVKSGVADSRKLAIVGWSYGGYAALQSAVLNPSLFKAVVAIAPVTDLETLRSEHLRWTDYSSVDARIGHGPHVVAGSPAQNAGRFTAPVLLFHGDRDQNVDIDQSRLMVSRLKGANKLVELVAFHDLDHQLDDSGVRAQMLAKTDAFLRATLAIK